MKRLKLLLLDAGIVIQLFARRLWPVVVQRCEIVLTETVVDECKYATTDDKEWPEPIDLQPDIQAGRIKCVPVAVADVQHLRGQFTSDYTDRMDPGETESLAFLLKQSEPCLLASADGIVFKVLGRLGRSDQATSLEAILSRIGWTVNDLEYKYREEFCRKYLSVGERDRTYGIGMAKARDR